MGREDDLIHREEGFVDEGLFLENVKGGSGEVAGPQRVDDGGFVHHLAAGDIDEKGPAFHPGDALGVDEVTGLRRERDEGDDDVGLAEEGVEGTVAGMGVGGRFGVDHRHVERAGAGLDLFGDASVADHPEGFSAEERALPAQRFNAAVGPPSRADETVGFGNPAGHVEQQPEGVIGGGFGESGRGVRGGDTAPPQFGEVEIVDAHRGIGDKLQGRSGIEQRGVDPQFPLGEHRGAVADPFKNLRARSRRDPVVRHDDPGHAVQWREMLSRNMHGDKNAGQGRGRGHGSKERPETRRNKGNFCGTEARIERLAWAKMFSRLKFSIYESYCSLRKMPIPSPHSPVQTDAIPTSAQARHDFFERVARECGTPCYLYDADEIEARSRELQSVFPAGVSRLFFSFKSNPLPSVAAVLRDTGCRADLTSPGEVTAALEAGFDLSQALYGGPGKGTAELTEAISAGLRHFSVESNGDLAHLAEAAENLATPVKALLRINPLSAPKAKLAMSGVASPFGFEEDVLRATGRETLALAGEWVSVAGIHLYWGTQIGDPEALLASFTRTVVMAGELSGTLGFPLEILNLGGGFPWPYAHHGRGPDLTPLRDGLAALRAASGPAREAEWWFESGRHLVASSGTLLTRVMEIKRSKDEKDFLLLDTGIHHLGGMTGLGRIPRFSIDFEVPPARAENPGILVDVVGQLCTPLDCIGKKITLPRVEPGDLLAIPNTGAYGLTASVTGFLSRPSPSEVVHRGEKILSSHRLRGGHERIS